MPKFRKKPVVIEARQLVGPAGETMRVAEWVRENGYPWLLGDATRPETLTPETTPAIPGAGLWIDPATGELVIRTLEGDMRATHGDWIIKGVQDEFYPCKPSVFESTYEPVQVEGAEAVEAMSSAQAAIERVRALHTAYYPLRDGRAYCGACEGDELVAWPCPTLRALDGAE